MYDGETTSTARGAGFGDVAETRGRCLVEGEKFIGLLPGFSKWKEVEVIIKDEFMYDGGFIGE